MKKLERKVELGIAVLAAVIAVTVPVSGGAVEGQEDVSLLIERGKLAYVDHCAACHGLEGKGDGLVAEYLTVTPSDLTRLDAPGGEFPFDDVYEIIDGREVPGHGTREMPVWGPTFKGLDEKSDKQSIKEKIVELVYFVKSIQTGAE